MENLIKKYFEPIKKIIRIILLKFKRECIYQLWVVFSLFMPTFRQHSKFSSIKLQTHFDFLSTKFFVDVATHFQDYPKLIEVESSQIINHEFNLLGSGLINVKHAMQCNGLGGYRYDFSTHVHPDRDGEWLAHSINKNNVPIAKELWSQLSHKYIPIDWQIDFKSGYRWSEKKRYREIEFGNKPGVDIKVPWELSRMQHLPTLALMYGFAKSEVVKNKNQEDYYQEIRNQFFDFMATNPPGYGVNWVCAMDVSIRLVNVLVSYDILKSSGANIDEIFKKSLILFIYSHANHIHKNLEWHQKYRGNHYLSNIAGLIYAGAFLSGDQANKWLEFGVQELITETLYQFNSDGSNFEGSTCYHRLSAEIVLWSSAIILRNDYFVRRGISISCSNGLIESFWSRVKGMARFTDAMTGPDGVVVQFGDNDSGRFMPFGGGEKVRAKGDVYSPLWSLDHRGLVAGVNSLFGKNEISSNADPASFFLGKMVSMGSNIDIIKDRSPSLKKVCINRNIWDQNIKILNSLPASKKWVTSIRGDCGDLRENILVHQFPDTGYFIFKGNNIFLAIRCGSIGLAGLGAHDHYDQLSLQLHINNQYVLHDPGTYIYTPLVGARELYRSFNAHNGPKFYGMEEYCIPKGIFDMRDAFPAECLYIGSNSFLGQWRVGSLLIKRMIVIESNKIDITDFSEQQVEIRNPIFKQPKFSQGYGQIISKDW